MIYKWEDIKETHPKQLKVTPIAAIPYKLRLYYLILHLSFELKMDGKQTELVNNTSKPMAPRELLD